MKATKDSRMDILLIAPDSGIKECSFPWGVLAVGSYLTNVKKRQVYILDGNTLSEFEFRRKLDHLLPQLRLVGIGCMTTELPYVKRLVDYIKEASPKTKIIIGGPHAVLEPEQTCRYKNVDFVAYTEGEQTVDILIEKMRKDNPDYENVPGLIYKTGGELKRTVQPEFVGFYDTDYTLLPESTRNGFRNYIQVLTGRGCSHRCRFCYNSVIRQAFRPRPVEDIIQELEKVVNEYNSKFVYFRDDNFFQVKQRIVDFFRLYKEKGFTFRWRTSCRASYFSQQYINAEFIKNLENVNCQALKIGIESGTQRVLDYLCKDVNIDEIKKATREIAESKGIKGNYSFMVGLPGQTVEEYIDTIKLIKFILRYEPGADIIGPQYFRIYPGGSLYEEIVEKYGYIKPDSFEGWAQKMDRRNDPFALDRDVKYPWIPSKGKYLALYGNVLVLLYRKPLKDFFTLKKFPALPFAILAKLRVKNDWYNHLYDMKLLVTLYNFYKKYFSTPADVKTLSAA